MGRQIQFGHDLGQEPVDDAVAAPWAIVRGPVDQDVGPVINEACHGAGGDAGCRIGRVQRHRRPSRRDRSWTQGVVSECSYVAIV